jgi:hypothetical protein
MEQAEAADAALHVFQAEPKLLEWTKQTVYGFSLYSGANQSLRDRLCPEGDASQPADRYREPAALMTVSRLYALFDRSAGVSFQTVKGKLADPAVQQLLVNNYVGRASHSAGHLESECRDGIAKFLADYAGLNVPTLKRLYHFRNTGLAHVTLQEVKKSISYQEMEDMVRLAAKLAHSLTFAVRSHHTLLDREPDSGSDRIREEWLACIRRDASFYHQASTTRP